MKKYFESMISEDIEVGVALAQSYLKSCTYDEQFDHAYIDELMLNVMRLWEGFGTEETELSRGKLNAYFIQIMHLNIMGGDLGDVPEWNILTADARLHLFNNIGQTWVETTNDWTVE